MSVTNAYAMPSGTGVALLFDSFVTDVSTGDEVQSITLSGNPSGGNFTLTFNGHTTSAIPAIPSPPYRYFQWNKTDLTPGTYDLAVNIFQGGTATPAQYYEVFDGATLLGTKTINHQGDAGQHGGPTNTGKFADPTGLHTVHGDVLNWYPLGRFTFSGATLAVRTSCDFASDSIDRFDCDNLRIATTDGAVVVRVGPAHPPGTIASPDFQIGTSIDGYQVADDTDPNVGIDGLGSGVRYLADPAVVQSALAALSTVGVGNVTVTGDGSAINALRVEFTGALTASSQPLMTATDAAVHVAEVTPGGTLPRLVVNGGSPIQVPFSWIFYDKHGMATVSVYPPVCSPTPVYRALGQYDDLQHGTPMAGGWNLSDGGWSNLSYTATNPSATGTWRYGPWKGATYRLSASWTVASGQSTSVVYTVKDLLGNVLGTHTVDQTVAPSGDTDQGVPWEILGTYTLTGEGVGFVVVQSNGTSLPMVANAIRFERTSSDDTLRFSAGDTVRMTWGAGWATTRDGGAITAQASPVTLTNLVDGQMVPPPPSSHNCEIGYNLPGTGGNGGSMIYQDVMAFGSDIVDGFPTTLPYFFQDFGLNATPISYDSDTLGVPNIPAGTYTLTWTGAGDCTIVSSGSAVTETTPTVFPGTPGSHNKRTYQLGGGQTRYGAEIKIRIHGTTQIGDGVEHDTDVTDVHLWPPGTDLANPPKYRADWLSREAPIQCRRHLDVLGVIAQNPSEYADYNPPQSRISKAAAARHVSATVSRMEAYSGPEFTVDARFGPPILVTTSSAHGFLDREIFRFSDDFNGVSTLANPVNGSTSYNWGAGDGIVYVVSPTKFMFLGFFAGVGNAVTNVITNPSGGVYVDRGTGMPSQDMWESFNLGPNLRTFYWQSALSTTRAAVEACITDLAANLKSGARVRHEFANEPWNNPGAVHTACQVSGYLSGLGDGSDYIPYYCHTANQHWAWGKAAWIAAGRDGADFIRVIGSQHVNPGETRKLANYCAANSLSMGDEVGTAPYNNCTAAFTRTVTGNPDFSAIKARLTVAQTLDQNEVYYTYGGYEGECQAHLDQLGAFPGMGLCFYEFSLNQMMLSGINGIQTNHGVTRHPRFRALKAHAMGIYATTGCNAIHEYLESSVDRTDGLIWSVYTSTGQLPYTPSTEQDAIQIDTPDRLDLIQSVSGTAVNDMAARFSASGVPPSLAAGTVTAGSVTSTTATASIAGTSGGTSPYSNQLQVTPYQANSWANNGSPVSGSGATLTATGLTPNTAYSLRVVVTDAASGSATSNAVTESTSAGSSSLTSGTLSTGSVTSSTATVSIATDTGGTAPYSNQLQVSAHGANSWSNAGSPVTGSTAGLTATGLTASTQYDLRVNITDSASGAPGTATSNVVTVTTSAASSGGTPTFPMRRLRAMSRFRF